MELLHLLCCVAIFLASIGAINWLAVAYGHNLVEMVTGSGTTATKVVYILVGISGLVTLLCKVKWLLENKHHQM